MENTWYDPNTLAWLPGVIMGTAAAVLGVLTGKFAPSASHPTLVLGGWLLFKTAAVLLTVAGIYAAWSDQPYGVWYGLMLPGLLGIAIAYLVLPSAKRRYARMAQDTSASTDASAQQSSPEDSPSDSP